MTKKASTAAEREGIGDWRNIKGNYYHLLYVIWMLLHDEGVRIAFYRGNDLLASPPAPGTQTVIPVRAQGEQSNKDIWIQLKSTAARWNRTSLIKDVLFNFVYNALTSVLNGRNWGTRLVTQAEVPQGELRELVKALKSRKGHPQLRSAFDKEVKRAFDEWKLDHELHPTIKNGKWTVKHARDLGIQVLEQLSETKPFAIELMASEIRNKTLLACFDPTLAEQIENSLIGALEKQASLGPKHAREFDEKWLNKAAGRPLRLYDLWDTNPVAACNQINIPALNACEWDGNRYVSRPRLEDNLRQFLLADEPFFALIGLSGVGKSWASAWAVTHLLQNCVRLIVPASELDYHSTLESLIASRLRPLTSAQHTETQLLQRWKSAARALTGDAASITNSPVLVLEDLQLPTDGEGFRRKLERIVGEAREKGIKIVLTCQEHIWRTARPGGRVSIRDTFHLEPKGEKSNNLHSFILGDLTPDEIEEVVTRRFEAYGKSRAVSIARQLRAPAFAALRNSYLLTLYLNEHGAALQSEDIHERVPPLAVDELLDARIEHSLRRVGQNLECDLADITPAFESLCSQLWDAQSHEIERNDAIRILETNAVGLGSNLFRELRSVGLLAAEGRVRLERTPVAERIFARELKRRGFIESKIFDTLRPEVDGGVIVALLRDLAHRSIKGIPSDDSAIDNIFVAERLLESDNRWGEAVCDGLAQGNGDDLRIVAMLCALARHRDGNGLVRHSACHSLGRFAARSRDARRWIARMYIGDDPADRYRSATALSKLLEFMPGIVTRLVSLRLHLAQKMPSFHSPDRERRERWLRAALDPLNFPRHMAAAEAAQKVVIRFDQFIRESDDWRQILDLTEVRGGLVPWNEEERNLLFSELESADADTRYLAASAMRSAAFQNVDCVADVMLRRIHEEKDDSVLSRLLWAAHPLTSPTYAKQFLESLRASRVVNWDAPLSTGPALTMLAVLASREPLDVLNLLPRELKHLDKYSGAYLDEALVHTWWALSDESERLPSTRQNEPHLFLQSAAQRNISSLDHYLKDIPSDVRPFAARSVITARLAVMGRGSIRASEAQMHEWGRDWPHYQAKIESAIGEHRNFLISHADMLSLQQAFIESIRLDAEAPHSHSVGRSWRQEALQSARFAIARSSLHCLAVLLHEHSDIFTVIEQLSTESLTARLCKLIENLPVQAPTEEPALGQDMGENITSQGNVECAKEPENSEASESTQREEPFPAWQLIMSDWMQVHFITRLLRIGWRDEKLIEFAQQQCQKLAQGGTFQSSGEREKCLAELARIRSETGQEGDVSAALQEHREQTSAFLFSRDDRVQGFVRLTDGHPERLLQMLCDSVDTRADLVTLHLWKEFTHDWPSLLIANVFQRMFDERFIGRIEAQRLCREMLVAVRPLPPSPLQEEWEIVYDFLEATLAKQFRPTKTMTVKRNHLGWSHMMAASILNYKHEDQSEATNFWSWFESSLPSAVSLIHNHDFHVGKDYLSKGNEHHAIFCFPAIRLACMILGMRHNVLDPIGQRMATIVRRDRELRRFYSLFGHPSGHSQQFKDQAVAHLEKLLAEEGVDSSHDDDLHSLYITALLIAGYAERAAEQAELELAEVVRKREAQEYVEPEFHAGLVYNLACARARLGDEKACRKLLKERESLGWINSNKLKDDPDMESVREKSWYKKLIERHREETERRTRTTQIKAPMIVTDRVIEGNQVTLTIEPIR